MSSINHLQPDLSASSMSSKVLMDRFEDVLRGKKLVFLVGAPRSGTTWLQLLLSRSPAVVTAPETHLFSLFLRSTVDQWKRLEKSGEKIGLNQILSEKEFWDLLRSASGIVFAKIAKSKPPATVILDKTPNHVYCWQEILETWPEAHFVHIIRDPRSVVASMRVASRTWASHWASRRVSQNCERWMVDVSKGREIRTATPNYQEVYFRELVSDGPSVVQRTLSGIGVQSCLEECERYVSECNIKFLRAGKLADAPFDIAKMNKESFRLGTTESWRDELSKYEVAIVENMAGPLMSEFKFEPATRSTLTAALGRLGRAVEWAEGITQRWL